MRRQIAAAEATQLSMAELLIIAIAGLTFFAILALYFREVTDRPLVDAEAQEVLTRRSFDVLGRAHPNLVRNGAVHCPNCNGRYQFFRRTCHYGLRCHACKSCGDILYYTAI